MRKYSENFSKIINKYKLKHKYDFGKSNPLITRYLNGIQRGNFTLISGTPTSGKTSFTDFFYVVLLVKQWFFMEDTERLEKPLKILYFSQTVPKELKLLKWTASIYTSMFKSMMDLPTMLEGPGKLHPLNKQDATELDSAASILDAALAKNVLTVSDGVLDFARLEVSIEAALESYGVLEHTKQGSTFKPKDGHEHTLLVVVIDNIDKIRGGKDVSAAETTALFNKLVEEYKSYGVSIIATKTTIPFIYEKYSPSYKDVDKYTPDKAIVMYNPRVTGAKRHAGFTVEHFIGKDMVDRLRFASIVKNDTGIANINIPLVFLPECGNFIELSFPSRDSSMDTTKEFLDSDDDIDIKNVKKLKFARQIKGIALKKRKREE